MSFNPSLDPFLHLTQWIQEAKEAAVPEHNAMVLSTVNSEAQTSNRVVLFKGLLRGGLSFYTNYHGRKAQDLAENPKAALNFFWAPLARQIRLEGQVAKLTRAESEAYFKTRPRLSQLGAWASKQSEVVAGVEELQQRLQEAEEKFRNQEVPCPPDWGGFHLIPSEFEFWIGHEGRLHERYIYQWQGQSWKRFMRFP